MSAAKVPTWLLMASRVKLPPTPFRAKLLAVMAPLPVSVTVPVLSSTSMLAPTFNAPVNSIPSVVLIRLRLSLTVSAPTVILPVPSLRPTVILLKPFWSLLHSVAPICRLPAVPSPRPMVVPTLSGLIVSEPVPEILPPMAMPSVVRVMLPLPLDMVLV